MTRILQASYRLLEAILRKRQLDERHEGNLFTKEPPGCTTAKDYDPFADIVENQPYGLYGERVTRIEKFPPGEHVPPEWFDPKIGHIAEHAPGGASAYIELHIDDERRAERHPFDNIIVSNARRRSVQIAMFES